MPILIFGVWVDPSSPPPPPFLRNVNLLQSNAMDDNEHRDGQIPPPFLDNSSPLNQESVHAPDQEQHASSFGLAVIVREPTLAYNDPWSIKKTLTKSDVNDVGVLKDYKLLILTNDLCRLMLKKNAVQVHILGKWDEERRRAVMETIQGVRADVRDADTGTVHQVSFKRWKSSGSFVFTKNWVTQFVKRRGLKEGDKIGLRCDSQESRFCFCVGSAMLDS
ncbi:B3 domain-containing protein At2g33720-like [Rhododendron vialii]|uniref:B3 domain-containing protein At2g33720-like n=1 Tax=Rhododendron vialii TaxID=182163 RepID=UPI00265F7CC4|nr:B3 domain-containing protein At2g33720-like [Rhododendron vialii]